ELADADAVMMLRVQAERMNGAFFPSAREYAVRYGLGPARASRLRDDVVVLHPGPMVRGMEIGFAAADAPAAAILQQVTNGVHVRMSHPLHTLVPAEGPPQGATRQPCPCRYAECGPRGRASPSTSSSPRAGSPPSATTPPLRRPPV